MTMFWNKKTKGEEPTGNALLVKRLRSFNDDFKQRVADAETKSSGGCVSNIFSCLRSTGDKIPQSYKDIGEWLTKLAVKNIQGNVDTTVLTTALYATLEYVSKDTVGTEIPAQILKDLINEIASELKLDLKIEPDFGGLEAYCDEHKIDIPQEISSVIAVCATLQ